MNKKYKAILHAALWGAALPTTFMALINLGYIVFGHGTSGELLPDFFLLIGMICIIPSMFINEVAGIKSPFLNAWIVNALFGALVFSLAAFFWQYVIKGNNEQ